MAPALVLQHDHDAPPALLAQWAAERGHPLEVVDARGPLPPLDGRPFVVALGSEAGAHDDALPWLAPERALLRDAVAREIPVLGICFGAQHLARALGGAALAGAATEVGWMAVDTHAPGVVPAGPWLQWHRDAFTIPPGADLLARSTACPQAYRLGPHLGVQFHPEVDAAVVEGWAREYPESLARAGTSAAQVLADTARHAPAAAAAARRLFDAFAAGARLTAPAPG